jgi:hypothetical protein
MINNDAMNLTYEQRLLHDFIAQEVQCKVAV